MLRKVFILLSVLLSATRLNAQNVKLYLDGLSAEMVTFEDGKKKVHFVSDFIIKGMKNQRAKIGVSIMQSIGDSDFSQEKAEKTYGYHYREVFIPSNNESFENFDLYVPFEQLRLLPGKHNYHVNLVIKDEANHSYFETYDKRHVGNSISITLVGPKIEIKDLQLSQNSYQNGEYGLKVSYEYDTYGLKDKKVDVYAYLIDENADLVSTQSSNYSINGYVARSTSIKQPYESTTGNGSFFFPNNVISDSHYGEHMYRVQLIVCDHEKVNELKDFRNSSWFYATRGEQYTSSSAKPRQNYNNSYASSSSARSSSSSSSYSSNDNSSAIGLGILLGLGAIAIDALSSSNRSSSSSSSYSSSSSSSSSSSTTGTLNGHSWVDMGLPSGTKWATCNVGASFSDQSGNYYAWGEVWTKAIPDGYSMSNYRFYESVTDESVKITKYNKADNRTLIYDATEDAACALWGGDGSWVTPTRAQFQELIDHCTWTWTTINGNNGYKVTSKKNGKTLFFPAGGHVEAGHRPDKYTAAYMTRERNPSHSQLHIYVLFFNSSERYVDNDWERSYGYLVRPVVSSR